MSTPDLFFNSVGRLRSGWRLAAFVVAFLVVFTALTFIGGMLLLALFVALGHSGAYLSELLESNWGHVAQALLLFTSATVAGWGAGRVLEDLPWRALGWTLHPGWWRDLLVGSFIGAVSLALAALFPLIVGGFRFAFAPEPLWPSVVETLALSGFIFVFSAAAEEALFRGYPLQTMLRAWPAWVAIIPSSLLFASVHLNNPNVVGGFTFVNTMLAGVWLAVAYRRTRSLWFPLGAHWAWNWTMGACLGLPVSGITRLAPTPLLRATETGPVWLTGGAYGIEGGAACTAALIISTIFIWRTRLVSANEDLKRLTDAEIPNPPAGPITPREPSTGGSQPPASDQSPGVV